MSLCNLKCVDDIDLFADTNKELQELKMLLADSTTR